ncbi:MAG: DEAD/DEAH box helicase family protein [Pseudonocardiaceae bacterium]
MGESFISPAVLIAGGPQRFSRQVERLLGQLGFTDIANIDGSGDQGGDILARLNGQDWVFQCKWRGKGPLPRAGVDEVNGAADFYRTSRAAVVTNVKPGPDAIRRARQLARIGRSIDFWTGGDLQELYGAADSRRAVCLRDYQTQAAARLLADLDARGRGLLILATGLGKTVIGGEVIAHYLAEHPSLDVLVVAHTKELVNQLERALWRHLPKSVKTQLLTGDEKPRDLRGITCATVASALNAALNGYRPGLVMVDETHHVGEDGLYDRLLHELSAARQFGVTATPWRGDQYDIEHHFGPASFKLGIEEGMRRGYLARVDYRLFVDNVDWDVVKDASKRSYSLKELNSKLFLPQRDEAVRDELTAAWAETRDPRAIVFCQTVEHAERMAELLRQSPEWHGTYAVHAGLTKRERQLRLLEFRSGRVPILTAVDILSEGVDIPDCNLIAFARVTHSRRIFVQQLGRGLRLREGKERLIALDFVSDLRRVAALLNIRRTLEADEVEVLPDVPQPSITFSDLRVESLLEQWILDAADLETANDEARLQFLDPHVMPT